MSSGEGAGWGFLGVEGGGLGQKSPFIYPLLLTIFVDVVLSSESSSF